MDIKQYEKKINDVITKCPIETGVEILVYNLIDDIINSDILSLVDINNIRKNKDSRLCTPAGIPDIAIVSNDFQFGKINNGKVYGFVEVKATNIKLSETKQISGHKSKVKHYIYTNGLVWRYCTKQDLKEKIIYLVKDKCELKKDSTPVSIDTIQYETLTYLLKSIDWE